MSIESATELKLRPFQAADVEAIAKHKHPYNALIASGQGTGKTIVSIACVLRDFQGNIPCLIACPASMLNTWKKEFKTWAPMIKVQVLRSMTTPILPGAQVFVMSWTMMRSRYLELCSINPKLIIGDEAHYAKNEDSERSQALKIIAKRCSHILLLSGTPLVNSTDELETLKDIFGEKEPLMIRHLLEDVAPDVPEKKRSKIPIKMSRRDAQDYRKAEMSFKAWLESELRKKMGSFEASRTVERSLVAMAMVKVGYLRRILGQAKVNAAVEWIVRAVLSGESVVVFAEHREVISMIEKALTAQRIRFVTINGDSPVKDRDLAVNAFQAGKVAVFIGSKAASTGITLTRARHLLFVERYWTSAEEEQAEDRIRRIGQKFKTTIWFLHCYDTIDDRIDEIVESKRALIRTAIGLRTVKETEEETVLDMISKWTTNIYADAPEPTSLGHNPLPDRLPEHRDVCALTFYGEKWTEKRAISWANMHGFSSYRSIPMHGGFRLELITPDYFVMGSFYNKRVSKEVQATLGLRHSTKRKTAKRKNRSRRAKVS